MLLEIWHLHRRAALIACGMLAGILALVMVTAFVLRLSSGDAAARTNPAVPRASQTVAAPTPAPAATDVASWDAIPPVTPAVSVSYPAIDEGMRRDPTAYARAFATELFARNYGASTRSELIAWAQYEDAPLQSPNYPAANWTKVLIDSLTDLSWDTADDTPIPSDGVWLALRAERAQQAVTAVQVSGDPLWEQRIADGYQPPDPLATVRDISLTVEQRTSVAGRTSVKRYAVSLALQLGSSPRGGYGVAATNNYVIKEVA